jgi:hypothetical protein
MSKLKSKLSVPAVKYSVLAVGTGLWILGLISQLSSAAGPIKYILMSLLIVAVALLLRGQPSRG